MHQPSRRRFLQQVGAASAAVTVAVPAYVRAVGTAERLSVGVIGCGGRGSGLLKTFGQIADVAYVCDPDEARREKAKEDSGANSAVSDLRRVFDDSSVDAVVVATPDHWHAPAAIMACEAGKARLRRETVQPQLPREPVAGRRGPTERRRRAAWHAESL